MPEIKVFTGKDVLAYVPAVARLRLEVFQGFPYLYERPVQFEEIFLGMIYANAPTCIFVLVFDGDELVGASNARPLQHSFKGGRLDECFVRQGLDPGRYFYLETSILREEYRGQGWGVRFFEEREAYAREQGFTETCFCAIQRPLDHPLRPANYMSLESFWHKRGYKAHPDLQVEFAWKDYGEPQETAKQMMFWLKNLQA